MNTVYGRVCDALGAAETERRRWATPAAQIRHEQPQRIRVDRDHSGITCGEVVHLERHEHGLWAVAHVDAEPSVAVVVGRERVRVPTQLYFSAERLSTDDWRDVVLTGLALTAHPAQVNARPVRWQQGTLYERSGWNLDSFERQLLARAFETYATRHGQPLIVHELGGPPPQSMERSTPGPLRFRSAQALAADASDRIIELLVVPYGVSAQVPWGDGRLVSESFARGAFSEAERSPSRVRINRDHDLKRTVGKALDFQDDPIGLLGVLKIAATPLGDETLALAEDGCLDASVGYRPEPGGEEWQGRSRVQIRRAHLGHVALTPDPTYEHARVLTVGGAAADW